MNGPILPQKREDEDEAEPLELLRPNTDELWDIHRSPGPERATGTDIDLFCPHCDYNLRGLTEDRCPECGHDFNRERLIRWSTEPNLPLNFTRSDHGEQDGFILIGSLSWPSRLGRELPPLANSGAAAAYGWGMRALGAFVIWIVIGVTSNPSMSGWVMLLPIIPILATLFCETMVALLLKRLVEPVAVPKEQRYRFWRMICRCFSTYFPISCAAVPLLARLIAPARVIGYPSTTGTRIVMTLLLMAGPALMILWWWVALGKAIAARGRPSTGRTAAIWLIPLVGAASVVFGIVLYALTVLFHDFVVRIR
jgi:hypothetical protein